MAYSIIARFPLGTYRGAAEDGQVEAFPSVSRLFSALLCAAGVGPRAVANGGELAPNKDDAHALRWLEENPPDSVYIPPLHVNRGRATAYRDDGTLRASKGRLTVKKAQKYPDATVAIDESFVWTWTTTPPEPVIDSVDALCADVPHLGGSESPVVLVTALGDQLSSHRLDSAAGLFEAGGCDVEVPVPGRRAELAGAHTAALKTPTKAKDRYKSDEVAASAVPTREAVALARYMPNTEASLATPWPTVLLLGIDRAIRPGECVAAAVAVHRALVQSAVINGDAVPPLVSGTHLPGAPRPANHLAVQFFDETMPVDLGPDGAAMGLMVPSEADAGDLAVLARAVERMARTIAWRGGAVRLRGRPRGVSGERFWRAPSSGRLRLWETHVPAIPDVRGVRDGGDWTFDDAARLALAFVMRDRVSPDMPPGIRGDARLRSLASTVEHLGVRALRTRPIRSSDVDKYFHKVNEHAVVRPYSALFSFQSRLPQCAVLAIGQSRHLGGGLLVPIDVSENEAIA